MKTRTGAAQRGAFVANRVTTFDGLHDPPSETEVPSPDVSPPAVVKLVQAGGRKPVAVLPPLGEPRERAREVRHGHVPRAHRGLLGAGAHALTELRDVAVRGHPVGIDGRHAVVAVRVAAGCIGRCRGSPLRGDLGGVGHFRVDGLEDGEVGERGAAVKRCAVAPAVAGKSVAVAVRQKPGEKPHAMRIVHAPRGGGCRDLGRELAVVGAIVAEVVLVLFRDQGVPPPVPVVRLFARDVVEQEARGVPCVFQTPIRNVCVVT